jgi:hypothetical protein
MPDAIDAFRPYVDRLKATNNPGAGNLPIPSELDEAVSEVINRFVNATDSDRVEISSLFTDAHSFTLIGFAERMATNAVRTGNPQYLFEGLVSLCIEAGKFDIREDILVLAPVYDAAVRLGAEPNNLFAKAASLIQNDVSDAVRAFPHRPDDTRSLSAMGYATRTDEHGFSYERDW